MLKVQSIRRGKHDSMLSYGTPLKSKHTVFVTKAYLFLFAVYSYIRIKVVRVC